MRIYKSREILVRRIIDLVYRTLVLYSLDLDDIDFNRFIVLLVDRLGYKKEEDILVYERGGVAN